MSAITAADITEVVRRLGAEAGDTLFAHAGMQGALRAEGESRQAKMDTVLAGLRGALQGGTLMLPTFSYSFCKGEDFDIARTPSTVGMLTEHFRTRDGVRRTAEPIFSTAIEGPVPQPWLDRLEAVEDKDCFGERSVFAYLWEIDALLLFFGVGFEFCTYIYLVEQRQSVPYRWKKRFAGDVIGLDGVAAPVVADYLVRDLEADVVNDFGPLAEELRERGALAEHRIPKGPRLRAVRAREVAAVATEMMQANPDYLLERGHERSAEVDT